MPPKIVFSQPVADLVKKRYSCRSFDGRGLESELLYYEYIVSFVIR